MRTDITLNNFRKYFLNPDSNALDRRCFDVARAGSEYISLLLDKKHAEEVFVRNALHKYRKKWKRSTPVRSLLPAFSSLTGREGDWRNIALPKGEGGMLADEIRMHHRVIIRNFLKSEVPLLCDHLPDRTDGRIAYLDDLLQGRDHYLSAEHPQSWLGNVSESIASWLLSGQSVGQSSNLPNDILLDRSNHRVAIEMKTMRIPHTVEWAWTNRTQNTSHYPSKKQFVLRLGQLNTLINTLEQESISGFYLIAPYHLRWAGGMNLTRFMEDRLGIQKWWRITYEEIDRALRSSIIFSEMWLLPAQELKYLITEHIQGMYPESKFNPVLSYPAWMAPFYLKTQMRHLASMALRLGSFEVPEYVHTATIFWQSCTIRSFGMKLSENVHLGEVR